MNKRWNINTFLCRKADLKVSNIEDIFDRLIIKKNGKADFTIVTVMSSICSDEERFGLFYFIEYLDNENMILYLCNSIYEREKQNQETLVSSMNGTSSKISRIWIEECEFPKAGSYEIKVYKYNDDELSQNYSESTEEMLQYADESHLVSIYPFKVICE